MPKRSPFDAAEEKGRQAARDGQSILSCPYKDKRTDSGRLTWSRVYRNAWIQGWQSERMDMGLKPWDCPRCDGTGERFNNATETMTDCGACKSITK